MCLSDEVAKCITNFYAVFCSGIDHVFEVRLDPAYRKRLINNNWIRQSLLGFVLRNELVLSLYEFPNISDTSTLLCLEKIYLVFENLKVLLGENSNDNKISSKPFTINLKCIISIII